jgi:lysophospholipase L1-like esterase
MMKPAGLLLLATLAFAGAAQAQDGASAAHVGVQADPCANLSPMPKALTDYLAVARKARDEKRPIPPLEGATRAVYDTWTNARLLEDFAGRCAWRDANAKLAPPAPDRVVFFGDSITQNWQVLDPGLFSDQVVDRGISGQTTSQMVIRFQDDVIALHPAVVHIMAGINDIAGNTGPTTPVWIETNIHTLVELAKAHGVRVVLSSILPSDHFAWRPEIRPAETVRALNASLKRYADAQGLVYVDYYPAMVGGRGELRAELTDDGVHPNAAGYAIMRPLAEAAIRRALAQAPTRR